MANVVIFGLRDMASLAHFYLKNDSPHSVVGFTADRQFLPAETTFEGLPIVPADELASSFPPGDFACLAPMSHAGMNRDRESVYNRLKQQGYPLISYVSSRATRFAGTSIGENCFILEDNTIQPFVTIGNNVVMWSGNHIGHHSRIGDHVFVASHVVLSGRCNVEHHCFFGVNATVRNHLNIAEGTLVGMGATITRDTAPWSVYKGTPSHPAELTSRDFDF